MSPSRNRSVLLCLAAVAAVAALMPAAATASSASGPRGELVSATHVAHLSTAKVHRLLNGSDVSPEQAKNPVEAYRLVYRTIDPVGRPTTASGLLALPTNGPRDLRTIVFEHGTTVSRDVTPSIGSDSLARVVSVLDASAGFATVAPDYLGTGVGPGQQAYLQVRSEVSASVDMVRAARTFAARSGRHLDTHLLVSGFSQGGQAAMGLGKALSSGAVGGLSLGGLTAVSGVYDLQHAEVPALVHGAMEPTISNYNLSFFALAWGRLYHLWNPSREAFQPGTAAIRRLFDGSHPEGQIFAALPPTLEGLFRPAFLAHLTHPHGALLRALHENDATCDWKPQVPVRLFFSPVDEAVAPLNTNHCVADLRARGAKVGARSVGKIRHLETVTAAAPSMLRWLAGTAPSDTR
jgi:hypothetical protein